MLGTGRAGVVGQDPQPCADGKPLHDPAIRCARPADDAVLLVRARHQVIGQHLALLRAHQPVAEVARLFLRAAVAAHRHPARVHDGPSFVFLVADHRGQHAQGDIGQCADAHVMHHEIEHHIDAGPDFGHAVEMLGAERGRRGADAHGFARQTCRAQPLGGPDAAGPLQFCDADEGVVRVVLIARAGVRQDAAQPHAALGQHPAHRDEPIVIGDDAGAVSIDVHFDPHFERFAVRAAECRDGLRAGYAVGDDFQVASPAAQCQRLGQPGRRHADGVDDVADARREELLGLLERGDRDALRAGGELRAHDRLALRRLDVRPEADAERVQALLHPRDVASHAGDVDQGGRCIEGGQAHRVVLAGVGRGRREAGQRGPGIHSMMETPEVLVFNGRSISH